MVLIRRMALAGGLILILCCVAYSQTKTVSNLTVINLEKGEKLVARSAGILSEEIEKRSNLRIASVNKMPKNVNNSVILCLEKNVNNLPASYKEKLSAMSKVGKEGYKLLKSDDSNVILVVGADPRGVLYGVGKLLRSMEIKEGQICIPEKLQIASTPKSSIRGHQLGYRPKTNAYDAWTVAQFDRYIRDLAIFGANSIEIIPPNTDDDNTSPLMKLSLLDMAVEQSKICDSYGIDVWMWYPNMGSDYENADSIKVQLDERREVFKKIPKLDALFVPGGDPGDLDPDLLFAFLEKEAKLLKEYHPQAKIWVSPQVFRPTKDWLDKFYNQVNKKYPWFGGVVFGPWVKSTAKEMRSRVDASIPIRHYPDITHSVCSQYPVPYWDLAFLRTLGRECINPRPLDEKAIHNKIGEFCDGSISYSEGINDDVNKFIWSDQDWDPDIQVINTLREYARFFISPDYAEDIAQGIMSLEQNFKGSLLTNSNVSRTYQQWQNMEKRLSEKESGSYRFQLALIRAYYDEYIYRRLMHERAMESNAIELLSAANELGSRTALSSAKEMLLKLSDSDNMTKVRSRCFDLADLLFANIGAQLTMGKHFAMDGRGNFMDNIDLPLNNSPWLLDQVDRISKLGDEKERLVQIDKVLNRTNPGPGGFYDNFGTLEAMKRLKSTVNWADDPGFLESPCPDAGICLRDEEWVHEITAQGFDDQACPEAWMTQFTTFYDNPLEVFYTDLDVNSSYRIKIAYTGRYQSKMKLFANGYLIHDFIRAGKQPVYEFKIPQKALTDGTILLRWETEAGERGCQVSEVWIVKED